MSQATREKKGSEIEAKAVLAEDKINGQHDLKQQLDATISAAELYMQALRLADNPKDKKRLDTKTRHLLASAEALKHQSHATLAVRPQPTPRFIFLEHPASTRQLTTREKIILLEGSKLNSALFKAWTGPPAEEEFELGPDKQQYVDNFEFTLSETQRKHFAGWKRPREALALIKLEKNGQLLPNEATNVTLGEWDLVQDVAPDCSLVASFCVGAARVWRGHKKLFSQIAWPYDYTNDVPREPLNGKYVLKLYFNGCWRRVEVDDRLPASNSARVLHVHDRSHPGLIWPTIAEKAYLKVRGGYDFPGSNSGTDLAVLIGWIPQQIFLHDEDVEPQSLWEELFPAFLNGEILCTLGTGKLGRREQEQLGLGAEHDYAVLELKESGSIREVLIKNPWADGDVWKGATRCRPNPGHEDDTPHSPLHEAETESMKPGTFWMDFNLVFQYFEHMYLNWNPGLFRYREDYHLSWQLLGVIPAGNLLLGNPQFAVKSTKSGRIWLLLNRHFRTGDYSTQNQGKNGYIGLYLFKKKGHNVFSTEGACIKGPFVDSPNTLLRFDAEAGETYTVVVVSQFLPSGKHNFTLSSFSSHKVELTESHEIYQTPTKLLAAWTRSTAGGSSDSARYLQNPQFSIRMSTEAQIVLVLRVLSEESANIPEKDLHVKLLVARSDGQRITKMRQRDVVSQSGDYKRGAAVIETKLPRGTYTVICSTFDQKQLSKFELQFYTTLDESSSSLKSLPAEGSGRFLINANPAVFDDDTIKLIAPFVLNRMTKVLFRVSLAQGSGAAVLKVSLEQGQGPYRRSIVTSSTEDQEYSTVAAGLRIEDINLDTSMASHQNGGLWLVLEKPSQASSQAKERIVVQVEILSEEKIEVGAWAAVED